MGEIFVEAKDIQLPARFLDTRFDLMDASKGEKYYKKGHIVGALYVDLEKHLSDMTKEQSGRHPMPNKEQLLNWMRAYGLAAEERIYIYDQGAAPFAARAYYMLAYAGFTNIAIVNGGFDALVAAGFEVTTDVPKVSEKVFEPNWQEDLYADRAFVRAVVEGELRDTLLLDARAAIRYSGEHEPLDPIAGHIPTAQNFDWEQLIEGKKLIIKEELINSVPKDKEVVVYCGSGVTASPLYTVLKEAGYERVRVYVGSFSDWINEHEVATCKK